MASLSLAALGKLREFLLASDGANSTLGEIGARDRVHLPGLMDRNVLIQNVPPKLADENAPTVYPALYLYCERMENVLRKKFTKFSGPIFLSVDVRVSDERMDGLDEQLARYVEAVRAVLGANQGQWTDNLAYSGAYSVRFREIELGGRNFIQTAQVEVEVQAHE